MTRAHHAKPETELPSAGLRRAVAIVGAANLAYFFVEFAVAKVIGSVSLFADSVDFLEDAAVNMGAGFVTMAWSSAWPDLVVGMGVALMNADAAKEVWEVARDEQAAESARGAAG